MISILGVFSAAIITPCLVVFLFPGMNVILIGISFIFAFIICYSIFSTIYKMICDLNKTQYEIFSNSLYINHNPMHIRNKKSSNSSKLLCFIIEIVALLLTTLIFFVLQQENVLNSEIANKLMCGAVIFIIAVAFVNIIGLVISSYRVNELNDVSSIDDNIKTFAVQLNQIISEIAQPQPPQPQPQQNSPNQNVSDVDDITKLGLGQSYFTSV